MRKGREESARRRDHRFSSDVLNIIQSIKQLLFLHVLNEVHHGCALLPLLLCLWSFHMFGTWI